MAVLMEIEFEHTVELLAVKADRLFAGQTRPNHHLTS